MYVYRHMQKNNKPVQSENQLPQDKFIGIKQLNKLWKKTF